MNTPATPVFLVLTIKGSTLARRLAKKLTGSEVHGFIGRVKDADLFFEFKDNIIGKLFFFLLMSAPTGFPVLSVPHTPSRSSLIWKSNPISLPNVETKL